MKEQPRKKKHILASYVRKVNPFGYKNEEHMSTADFTEVPVVDNDEGIVRKEKFYSYFIYSNKENKMIGCIYLTENQAYTLNRLMKLRFNKENPDISFIRS